MISNMGLVIICADLIAIIVYIHNSEKLEFFFLIQMFVLSLFFGMGYVLDIGPIIYYDMYGELVYIVISLLVTDVCKGVTRGQVFAISLFLLSVFAGYVIVMLGINMPYIVSWDVTNDDVFYGRAQLSKPMLGASNRYYLIRMLIFFIVTLRCRKYFVERKKIDKVIEAIKNAFSFYFTALFIELAYNNIVSKILLRQFILKNLGVIEISEPFYQIRTAFGWAGADGFFSEPSYIGIAFFYLIIMCVTGIRKKVDYYTMIMGGVMFVACGAQTGFLLLPLWGYIWVKSFILPKIKRGTVAKIRKKVFFWRGIFMACVIALYITNESRINSTFERLWGLVNDKYAAYMGEQVSGSLTALSGATRAFGNNICYSAFFKSPLFGVGLGTTRGYGILPGALACLGIVGCIFYIFYMKVFLNLTLRRNVFMVLLIFVYCAFLLSVTYLDMAAIILMFIPFSRLLQNSYDEKIGVNENEKDFV